MNTINDSNFPPEFTALWQQVAPFSMTSPERGFALWCAVNTVISNNIPGAFVECGVWKGGSSMLIALTLLLSSAVAHAATGGAVDPFVKLLHV